MLLVGFGVGGRDAHGGPARRRRWKHGGGSAVGIGGGGEEGGEWMFCSVVGGGDNWIGFFYNFRFGDTWNFGVSLLASNRFLADWARAPLSRNKRFLHNWRECETVNCH